MIVKNAIVVIGDGETLLRYTVLNEGCVMIEKPAETMGDSIHTTARAVIATIPFFGGAALELFNVVLAQPIEIRKQKWMEEVSNALNELKQNIGLDFDKLKENEQFISTMLQASTLAIKNHQIEKLEALKNAVLNSALPNSPEESLQQMFLSCVDSFSVWHIKLLVLFHNPMNWFINNNKRFPDITAGGLSHILEAAYPELSTKREFYDLVWSELSSKNFTKTNSLHGTMTLNGLQSKRTSELGDVFLKFISKPS